MFFYSRREESPRSNRAEEPRAAGGGAQRGTRLAVEPVLASRSPVREQVPSKRRQRGFTMVEMAIVAAMITILALMAVPVARYTVKRQDELELRHQLRLMRNAIDKFKQYCDAGLLPQPGLEAECYPPDLETLVEGVDLIGQVNKKMKFLRRIPIDPMTKKPEWGMRSFQDEPDSFTWGGQNVYDVFTLSNRRGIDGTYYKDW